MTVTNIRPWMLVFNECRLIFTQHHLCCWINVANSSIVFNHQSVTFWSIMLINNHIQLITDLDNTIPDGCRFFLPIDTYAIHRRLRPLTGNIQITIKLASFPLKTVDTSKSNIFFGLYKLWSESGLNCCQMISWCKVNFPSRAQGHFRAHAREAKK